MAASTSTRPARNVVLVGEAGSGKTSIINMIAGNTVAPISEVTGTRSCAVYPIQIGALDYNVYDTPGVDAPGLGTDPVTKLVERLQDGVSLLVFCLRGRITEDVVAIYQHFSQRLKRVPVVIVITGLEHEDPMKSWWMKNEAVFDGYRMSFKAHACVTTLRGKGSIFASQYEESKVAVRDLIATHSLKDGQKESHRPLETPAITGSSSSFLTHIPIEQRRRRPCIIISSAVACIVIVVVIVVAVEVSR